MDRPLLTVCPNCNLQSTNKCNTLAKQVQTYFSAPSKFSCSFVGNKSLVISAEVTTGMNVADSILNRWGVSRYHISCLLFTFVPAASQLKQAQKFGSEFVAYVYSQAR